MAGCVVTSMGLSRGHGPQPSGGDQVVGDGVQAADGLDLGQASECLPFRATMLVAALWLQWHAPLFWVNATMSALVGLMLIGWGVGLLLGAFALSHLYLLSGRSVAAVAVWHAAYHSCVATPATTGFVAAIVSTAVMVWGAAVLWT